LGSRYGICCLRFLLLTLSAFALRVTVGVEPKAVEVKPGENFTLSIVVDPQGSGVSGGEIAVFFKGLEVIDVSAGDLLGPKPLVGFKYVDNAEGVLRVAIARVGRPSLLR